MANFVPPPGWSWTFIAFWTADFIGLLFWILWKQGKLAFGTKLRNGITAIALLMLFLFAPVAEGIYVWSRNEDPWNTAPYIQWLCVNLRLMGLVFGFMLVSAYVFTRTGATRFGMKIAAYTFLMINGVGLFIVAAWKPNLNFANGTARTPSQFIPAAMNWIYVVNASLTTIGFMVMACRRYSLFFDFTRRDETLELTDDKGNANNEKRMQRSGRVFVVTMTLLWLVVLAITLTYAILLAVRRDQYMFEGSQIYYFHTQYWITRLGPITSVFMYPVLWFLYLLMWNMASLQVRIKGASVQGKGASDVDTIF